jgi:hypothetical protein
MVCLRLFWVSSRHFTSHWATGGFRPEGDVLASRRPAGHRLQRLVTHHPTLFLLIPRADDSLLPDRLCTPMRIPPFLPACGPMHLQLD